jgi:hypothetical protein
VARSLTSGPRETVGRGQAGHGAGPRKEDMDNRDQDMHDRAKAVRVASLYLATYAPGASPEVQARVWNGGPRGASKPATLGYWARVKREIGGAR